MSELILSLLTLNWKLIWSSKESDIKMMLIFGFLPLRSMTISFPSFRVGNLMLQCALQVYLKTKHWDKSYILKLDYFLFQLFGSLHCFVQKNSIVFHYEKQYLQSKYNLFSLDLYNNPLCHTIWQIHLKWLSYILYILNK